MIEDIRYCEVTTEEVESLDFACLALRDKTKIAYFQDGEKALVKYIGSQPQCLAGKQPFTVSEILARKKDPEDPLYEPPVEI